MSFWELIVIILVALIVIKPERLPEVANVLGKLLWRIRWWYDHFIKKISLFP